MPTVRDLRLIPFRIPLKAPLRWGKSSELAALEHALLEVELSDGSIGRAEVAIRPTIYGETLGSVRAGLEYLRPRLLGLEADDQEAIRAVLEGFPYNFGLKGALDTALWEAWARSEGEELHQVLKPAKHRVRVAYILGLGKEEEVLEDARMAYGAGVRVFKVKVGRDLEADTKRLLRLKEALPEAQFYADANETLSPEAAERYLLAWKELGLLYVEEPLPIERVAARKRLREKGILPLIADDSAMTLKDLRRELELNTFDILNLKPARTGITWTLEMLALAREKGKKAMVGSQAQSSFGAYQSALLAFQQGVTEPNELAFHLKAEGGFLDFPTFRQGWLYWEDLVEARFDEEAFARYALKEV
ncbi:Mandelate racemase/muconate lactonizing protein [Thermus thermophilus SG0.5JP17-16]|uniref:Mandelate racemase/muconate lactonizing protein n=1 Tax=Thermus thermophilus (strain SG0.5JP17-16) TaxID=762633 RepID=F6DFH7_THETG|nr:enolase C-terminal domain-like protein [Thermus thermophilus]AEG34235.1 Mandelate racemase/muconate lactonizing protein [Thermus thermophilus SG0.5JP17-16]